MVIIREAARKRAQAGADSSNRNQCVSTCINLDSVHEPRVGLREDVHRQLANRGLSRQCQPLGLDHAMDGSIVVTALP